MQSKNVLLLGILFTFLLITFSITQYIDKFNPNIKTITSPKEEVIDPTHELNKTSKKIDSDDYLQTIKLIEKEERNIEKIYNQAIKEEKLKNKQIQKIVKERVKPVKKIEKKPIKKTYKKFTIEEILDSITIKESKYLLKSEKIKLKKLALISKKNRDTFLKIESAKKSKKTYLIKKYFRSLGILTKKIEIIQKRESSLIEISVIKKDS